MANWPTNTHQIITQLRDLAIVQSERIDALMADVAALAERVKKLEATRDAK